MTKILQLFSIIPVGLFIAEENQISFKTFLILSWRKERLKTISLMLHIPMQNYLLTST